MTSREDPNSVTQAVDSPKVLQPLAALVRVVSGAGAPGASLRLGPGVYRIGAGSSCDLILEDTAVSRSHLEVALTPEGVRVKDLNSRNGTHYLGQRVGEMVLSLGSRLEVGTTELEFLADTKDFEGTQGAPLTHYGPLIGTSPSMQHLFTLLRRLEGSLVNVLIEGESGTGKELIARALHDHSQRSSGPFIAINCGALDRSLVRSELFGHKKGAFTGALGESLGAFAEADGGTLFLDEIGELPLEIQPVLLRVLECGAYTRVGESKPRPVKVRVIAATHRTLSEDVTEGLFRADLYYRLMVVQLHVPGLRHRREDIPILAEHIARSIGMKAVPAPLLAQLNKWEFPGNIRELKHAIMAYGAVGELPGARPETPDQLDSSLAAFLDPTRPYAEQKEALIERMTYLYLKQLIESTAGNRSEAARVAELQRGYLRRLLEKYGLD